MEKIKKILEAYTDQIREYEHESGHSIHNDARESAEFVELFMKSKDFVFERENTNHHNNMKLLNAFIQKLDDKYGIDLDDVQRLKDKFYNEEFPDAKQYEIKNA
jgi:hypothetical protein